MRTHEEFYHHIADHADDERIIDERDQISIEFSYPLHRPTIRTFLSTDGFTRGAFVSAVGAGYAAIYEEEENSCTISPEPTGILMNRSTTDGVHGIWGHDLSELMLEGAYRDDDGIWHLEVGS